MMPVSGRIPEELYQWLSVTPLEGATTMSDKLRVASIGVGGMGYNDVSGVFRSGKADIVALCDVDDTRAARARKDHEKATYYKDYRIMLEKEEKNIDAVTMSFKCKDCVRSERIRSVGSGFEMLSSIAATRSRIDASDSCGCETGK